MTSFIKKIKYSIKNTIKIFIKTITDIDFLIPCIYALVVILLSVIIFNPNKVEAATINEIQPQFSDGRYHTYYISNFTHNEQTDTYDCDFYTYLGSLDATEGNKYFWSGKISIPSSLYNQDRWVLHLISNGSTSKFEIVVVDGLNDLYIGRRGSSYDTLKVVKSLTGSAVGLKRYQSTDWQNWTLLKEYNSNDYYIQRRFWQPNGILLCKNCRVQFYDHTVTPHNYCDYSSMTIRPNIDLQKLSVYENDTSLFKLDLGYFHDDSFVNGEDTLTKVLQNINVTIKDMSNNNTFSKDLKSTKAIQEDEEGKFYIDFNVWDISTQLGTGNYLVSIEPVVKTTLHNGTYFTNNWLDYNTIINYKRYYTFKANNGYITDLTNSNSDGSPENPPDNPDNPEDTIDNIVQNGFDSILNDHAKEITSSDLGISMPSFDNVPDLTNVFTLIYNTFTQVYEQNYWSLTLTLPNNRSFVINFPTDAISSKLPESSVNFIQVIYWVVLGSFVLRFIFKVIKQVQTLNSGGEEGSSGFLDELTMTPSEYVLFNLLK